MPELPEVETTAALVRPDLIGRRIEAAHAGWERSLGGMSLAAFQTAVEGATIRSVGRRAKWILIALERLGQPAGTILCHLRMSGRLVVDSQPGTEPYERVSLELVGVRGKRTTLRFLDVRKFGRFRYLEDEAEVLAGLGPEPLGPEFTPEWLTGALASRSRAIKPLLLDQTFLAGLGNIYVDESLFQAGLHPLRPANRVPRANAARLHRAIQETLSAAIEREGSSFDAFYRTPLGQPGEYQHLFRVYGREGQPCPECGRTIIKLVVGQRGTHVCPSCQPKPRAPRRKSAPRGK